MHRAVKHKNDQQNKRYGHHQKRSKRFVHTYLPYLPMLLILFISVFVSGYTPKHGTLAYATEVSKDSLLNATNSERSSHGKSSLKINDTLSQAAQAKANDMTNRNYWSHNTPDGQEPWVFINGAGYSYIKAGENLAYGFTTSKETVNGWMNSPSHRDNLLDPDYVDVGFGYANSSNYNKAGQETVVVAMYGNPQNESANTAGASKSSPASNQQNQIQNSIKQKSDDNFASATLGVAKPITRIEALTKGKAPWALAVVSFITGGIVVFMLVRHGYKLRRLLRDSERFILHHPLLDTTLVALIILGLTLTRTVGFIH